MDPDCRQDDDSRVFRPVAPLGRRGSGVSPQSVVPAEAGTHAQSGTLTSRIGKPLSSQQRLGSILNLALKRQGQLLTRAFKIMPAMSTSVVTRAWAPACAGATGEWGIAAIRHPSESWDPCSIWRSPDQLASATSSITFFFFPAREGGLHKPQR